jgi:Uma2 family endonuclease
MALPVSLRLLTPEEYLRIEREAPYKSEYYAGEMFAMAGGSANHSLITANTLVTMGSRLRGRRCRAYDSNLRIGILEEDLYSYPDASVFCAPLAFVPGTDDTAVNPTVIVEVLSKSTEAYDRGKKFEHYRRLASLREYILVSQDSPTIERFAREADGRWVLTEAKGMGAVLRLDALEIDVPLAEIYDQVDFRASESATPESGTQISTE